jgi:phenylpyruvate tautomerase PptA (4-oxalocrotonate tautomerase family)
MPVITVQLTHQSKEKKKAIIVKASPKPWWK